MTSVQQDSKRSVQTKTGQKALRELSLRQNREHTDGFEGTEGKQTAEAEFWTVYW